MPWSAPPPASFAAEPYAHERFRDELVEALAAEGVQAPDDGLTEEFLTALGRMSDLVAGPTAWDAAINEAFAAALARSPQEAYSGLGWASAAFAGRPALGATALWACATEGEADAAAALMPVWGPLHALRRDAPQAWRTALFGDACLHRRLCATDGLAGDAYELACIGETTGWHAPLASPDPAAEMTRLERVIRAWRAHGWRGDDPQTGAVMEVSVVHVETLHALAALGRVSAMECVRSSSRAGLAVEARLSVDAAPLVVRATLLAPNEVFGHEQHWAEQVATPYPLARDEGRLAAAPGITPMESPTPTSGWVGVPARSLASHPRCDHAVSGRWAPNCTNTALVLRCDGCGRQRIALCWRDELPEHHDGAIPTGHHDARRLGHARRTLAQLGSVQRVHGGRVPEEMLDPTAYAHGPAAARPPVPRAVSPEALLCARSRTRGRRR